MATVPAAADAEEQEDANAKQYYRWQGLYYITMGCLADQLARVLAEQYSFWKGAKRHLSIRTLKGSSVGSEDRAALDHGLCACDGCRRALLKQRVAPQEILLVLRQVSHWARGFELS